MKSAALLVALVFSPGRALAIDINAGSIEAVLDGTQMPGGVVFEIMAWEDRSWDWAAPLLQDYAGRLWRRFPGLDLALVSHGHELFDLALRNRGQHRDAVELLAELHDRGIDIHVDGEYARWKRLGPKDFPGFVNLTESGSAQLEDYLKLGFVLIRLEAPDATD